MDAVSTILKDLGAIWTTYQTTIVFLAFVLWWNWKEIKKRLPWGSKAKDVLTSPVLSAEVPLNGKYVKKEDCHFAMDTIKAFIKDDNAVLHEKINKNNADTAEIKGYVKALVEMKGGRP
jgi:hypothetical protein